MDSVIPAARRPAVLWLLREPLGRAAWADFRYVLVSLPVAVAGFAFTVVTAVVGVVSFGVLVGPPLLALSAPGARGLAAVSRGLAGGLLGTRVAPPPPFRPRPGVLGWIWSGGMAGPTPDAAAVQRAFELVDAAHGIAKEAITELRDLAHGIHPPVLDRGLGAALASLATRSAVPVELKTDLPERPSAAIETIAYFCAAELLANVAKHSGARQATLEAVHGPGLLRVRVSDDGAGGARADRGSGLAGLIERLRTVDGRMRISSPPGGPTVVTVELPSHA